MKGVVLETKNKYTAILKEDGTVVRIRGIYTIGETIEVTKKMELPSHRNRTIHFVRAAAIAAAVMLAVLGAGGYYYTATAASTVTIHATDGDLTLSLNRLDRVIRVEASGDVRDDDVKALYDGGIKNTTLPEALDKVSGILNITSEDTQVQQIPIDIKTGYDDKFETMKSQAAEKGFLINNESLRDEVPVNEDRKDSSPVSEIPDEGMHEAPTPSGDPANEKMPEIPQDSAQPQTFEPVREEFQGDESIPDSPQSPEPAGNEPLGDGPSRGEEMGREGSFTAPSDSSGGASPDHM